MTDQHYDMNIPGKFTPLEEVILEFMYENPNESIGTASLALVPKIAAVQTIDEVQYAIESLILARLVRGKRTLQSGKVRHIKVKLTAKGEAVAIQEQRRVKNIRLNIMTIGE